MSETLWALYIPVCRVCVCIKYECGDGIEDFSQWFLLHSESTGEGCEWSPGDLYLCGKWLIYIMLSPLERCATIKNGIHWCTVKQWNKFYFHIACSADTTIQYTGRCTLKWFLKISNNFLQHE